MEVISVILLCFLPHSASPFFWIILVKSITLSIGHSDPSCSALWMGFFSGCYKVKMKAPKMLKQRINRWSSILFSPTFRLEWLGFFFWCAVGNMWHFLHKLLYQISGDMNGRTWCAIRKLSVCKSNRWSRLNKEFYQTTKVWRSSGILLELWFQELRWWRNQWVF